MSSIKRIIVFGATGQTGLKILQRGIKEGIEVTAYVRTSSKIPQDLKDKLYSVVEGDIFDKEKVENAIEGNHAALSALGSGASLGKTTIMSQGCSNIVSGMKKHNVRNLIVISGAILLPSESGIFASLVKTFVKATNDHIEQLKILERVSDDIDWIAMMPPFIKDRGDVNPNYLYEKDRVPGVTQVTTAELADFMITTLADKTKFERFKHSKVGISSKPK